MGCWNQTCALTHLPIMEGEPVVGFILVPSWYGMEGYYHRNDEGSTDRDWLMHADPFNGGGICEVNAAYKPLTIPVFGFYDDYGSIEFKKNGSRSNQVVLDLLNKMLESGDFDVKEEHGEKSITKFKTLKEAIRAIERGRTPFALMMVLQDAYYKAIENRKFSPESWSKQTHEGTEKELALSRQTFVKVDKLRKKLDNAKTEKARTKLFIEMFRLEDHGEKLDGSYNAAHVAYFTTQRICHNKLAIQQALASDDAFIPILTDLLYFHLAMTDLRRTWVAQAGQGSQQVCYIQHRKLAEFVQEHVAKKKKEHEKEVNMDIPEEREYCDQLY